jgi:arginine/lysine/ornithine decarboxylase
MEKIMNKKSLIDQEITPLFDAIMEFIEQENVPLFIPSHKQGRAINQKWKAFVGEEIFKMDLSEVQGLDDLHQPKGAILEAQRLAAMAWGADESFFLVNGTSSGIVASLSTIANEGDNIIVPRNAHKSAIFGLIVSGANPIYIAPEINNSLGLLGGIDPTMLESKFSTNANVKGVFGINPTYHGICSDLKKLIDITHQNKALFIADEAHGNHVYFHNKLPAGALTLGADFVCQSIHKMSGSLTQSSILHIQGNGVDVSRLKANLQMAQNTSPSYLLLASLDLARSLIATKGKSLLGSLLEDIMWAKEKIKNIPGIDVLDDGLIGQSAIFDYEPIRIVFSARRLGLLGYDLYKILRKEHNIEVEFGDYYYAICVLGLGTRQGDLQSLIKALEIISNEKYERPALRDWEEALPPMPPIMLSPRIAFFSKRERVPWENAKGRISAEMITPYPPGIPAICPGEEITADIWDYLEKQRKEKRHLHGPPGGVLDSIDVVI